MGKNTSGRLNRLFGQKMFVMPRFTNGNYKAQSANNSAGRLTLGPMDGWSTCSECLILSRVGQLWESFENLVHRCTDAKGYLSVLYDQLELQSPA